MNPYELGDMVDRLEQPYKQITVHTGGNSWEAIEDIVFCSECDQYHIISERVPLEGSTIHKE